MDLPRQQSWNVAKRSCLCLRNYKSSATRETLHVSHIDQRTEVSHVLVSIILRNVWPSRLLSKLLASSGRIGSS
jgi:hypothetical protein